MSTKARLRPSSASHNDTARRPGVSTSTPPPGSRTSSRAVVVWRPRWSPSRTGPVSCTSAPTSRLTSVDLPTPDAPINASVRLSLASARISSMPSPVRELLTITSTPITEALIASIVVSVVTSSTMSPFVSTTTGVAPLSNVSTSSRSSRRAFAPFVSVVQYQHEIDVRGQHLLAAGDTFDRVAARRRRCGAGSSAATWVSGGSPPRSTQSPVARCSAPGAAYVGPDSVRTVTRPLSTRPTRPAIAPSTPPTAGTASAAASQSPSQPSPHKGPFSLAASESAYARRVRTTIALFTRDLRVHDNPMLASAQAAGDRIVPLFVLDDAALTTAHGRPNRLGFLCGSLRDLDASLRRAAAACSCGGATGSTRSSVSRRSATRPRSTSRATSAGTRSAGSRVSSPRSGPEVVTHDGITVVPPDAFGKAFVVFTPYFDRWCEMPWQEHAPLPRRIAVPDDLPSEAVPAVAPPRGWDAGETAGLARRTAWVTRGLRSYATDYEDAGADATSRLSPYLHFGCLSPSDLGRRLWEHDEASELVRQLCRRDFFAQLLFWRPEVAHDDVRPGVAPSVAERRRATSRCGKRDAPAFRSSTPGCASCAPRDGCPTGCGWSRHRSSPRPAHRLARRRCAFHGPAR